MLSKGRVFGSEVLDAGDCTTFVETIRFICAGNRFKRIIALQIEGSVTERASQFGKLRSHANLFDTDPAGCSRSGVG
jgi:hypothetical protein